MHLPLALAALAVTSNAFNVGRREPAEALYVLEFAPGDVRTVTETEKWALKAEGKKFFDITELGETIIPSQILQSRAAVTFPSTLSESSAAQSLIAQLSKDNLQTTLQTFSDFHNRFYQSPYGQQSSAWLLAKVQSTISASAASGATVAPFTHSWTQSSIIATIPGKNNKTIIVGAHQDSINGEDRMEGRAPGADDDGSGSMTILEAFRVLLTDSRVAAGEAENTIEFHWYSGEEGGLLGSSAIFAKYSQLGRDVKAMFNQDMTGYVRPGVKEAMGIVTDFVDTPLTEFIKMVITAYCAIPYANTQCGYACSDHASALKAGYPSAFVIESTLGNISPNIHSSFDTMSTINFDHMMEHAKMTVGATIELAFADFE